MTSHASTAPPRPHRWIRSLVRVRAVAVAAGLLACAMPAAGQGTVIQLRGRVAGRDTVRVSLLTVGPGEEVFDRFGHAAIRVRNTATGLDSAWNWGMFDFNSPNFIPRFLTGETRYWMAGFPTGLFVDYYRRAGRAVWEQDFDLDPAQADSVLTVLRWNARDENKFYRYDYYLDNCSTRVRDAIDAAVGGALRRVATGPSTGITWRSETMRLAEAFPILNFGMTFTLGPRADRELSRWDELFIPMHLRDAVRAVRVPHADGEHPLVAAERTLVPVGAFPEAARPPTMVGWAALVGIVLAAMLVLLGRVAPRGFGTAAGLWHGGAGLAGGLVLWAGSFTRHVFMGLNTNVLAATPVSLALAVLVPLAMARGASERMRRAAAGAAAFTVVAWMLALASHLAPSWAPADLAPLVFAGPLHVVVAMRLWARRAEGAA
jgi:hypothetical protein